jgi:hypothetical protein
MAFLRAKFLSSASIAVVLLSLNSCSTNKPDHPQKMESFSERRNPQENSKASSGALGSDVKKKVKVDYEPTKANNTNVVDTPEVAKPKVNKSFMNRLMGVVGREDEKSDEQSSLEGIKVASIIVKRNPSEQSEPLITHVNNMQIAQGSKSSQSYFDIAEPIKSAPVYPIIEEKLSNLNIINTANANETDKLPPAPQAPLLNNGVPLVNNNATPSALPNAPMPLNAPQMMPTQQQQNGAPIMHAPVVSAPTMPTPVPAPVVSAPVMPTPMHQNTVPLTNVPTIPSNDHLKGQVNAQPTPQLSTVANMHAPMMKEQAPAHMPAPIAKPITSEHQNASVLAPMNAGHDNNAQHEPAVNAPQANNPEAHHETMIAPVTKTEELKAEKVVEKGPKPKKHSKKAAKKKPAPKHDYSPADFEKVIILDHSELVEENGHYTTKKFLTAPNSDE